MNGRHRITRRHHRGVSVLVSASVIAGLAVGVPSLSSPAAAADACLTPRVADVMVTQGLPNYKRLVQGKRALVKVFLQTPSCAPTGTAIRVTKADLTVNGAGLSVVLPPVGALPLSEIAPATTSPVPTSQGDPIFGVPGNVLKAPAGVLNDVSLAFKVILEFSSSYKDAKGIVVTQTGRLEVANDEEGKPVTALLGAVSNPLRVVTVPLGDAGTLLEPKTADSQFGPDDKSALTRGLTALGRVLPVADGVTGLGESSGGLRSSMSSGLINVGPISPTNRFCGSEENFTDIDRQLNLARINWNSVNPNAPADRAYGVIAEGISSGGVDATSTTCADGYASVNGTTAWGRVVEVEEPTLTTPKPSPAPVRAFTGALATMELLHTTGAVDGGSSRSDGDGHSRNAQADVTAPDRAWNVPAQQYLATDRSSMAYRQDGVWNDGNALLEKPDWDTLVCQLTPALAGGTECPTSKAVGRAGAVLNPGTSAGSFFLAGKTNGTAAGTDAHTYIDEDRNYERPNAASEYRFLQLDAQGNVLGNDGFTVSSTYSHHRGPNESGASTHGTFGTEFPAVDETTELRLYKGDPTKTSAAVLLHSRLRNDAPEFFAASVSGRTVAVQALDETPQNLRLDIFHVCPGGLTSPIVNAAKPQRVAGSGTDPVAVFTEVADTSLGCNNGFLRYRLSDGFLVSTRDEVGTSPGLGAASAAIYAPLGDAPLASRKVIALAGEGKDVFGRAASSYVWSIQGPSYPTATEITSGAAASFYPPAAGLQAGNYVLTLRTTAIDGSIATATRGFSVCQDTDGDGLCDQAELLPCYSGLGYNPVTSQANAHLDSDFDGIDNTADGAPCVSLNNAFAQFTATALNTSSNGNTVMMKVTSTQVDLTKVTTADVAIVQITGHRLADPMPALAWVAESTSSAKVTFDRQLLSEFIARRGITGPTPIYLVAPTAGLRAGDAHSPSSF